MKAFQILVMILFTIVGFYSLFFWDHFEGIGIHQAASWSIPIVSFGFVGLSGYHFFKKY